MKMNTTTIKSQVENIAKKLNIKLVNLNVELNPSFDYGKDTTNDIYSVSAKVENPEAISQDKMKSFMSTVESECYEDWKYETYIDIENFDIEED